MAVSSALLTFGVIGGVLLLFTLVAVCSKIMSFCHKLIKRKKRTGEIVTSSAGEHNERTLNCVAGLVCVVRRPLKLTSTSTQVSDSEFPDSLPSTTDDGTTDQEIDNAFSEYWKNKAAGLHQADETFKGYLNSVEPTDIQLGPNRLPGLEVDTSDITVIDFAASADRSTDGADKTTETLDSRRLHSLFGTGNHQPPTSSASGLESPVNSVQENFHAIDSLADVDASGCHFETAAARSQVANELVANVSADRPISYVPTTAAVVYKRRSLQDELASEAARPFLAPRRQSTPADYSQRHRVSVMDPETASQQPVRPYSLYHGQDNGMMTSSAAARTKRSVVISTETLRNVKHEDFLPRTIEMPRYQQQQPDVVYAASGPRRYSAVDAGRVTEVRRNYGQQQEPQKSTGSRWSSAELRAVSESPLQTTRPTIPSRNNERGTSLTSGRRWSTTDNDEHVEVHQSRRKQSLLSQSSGTSGVPLDSKFQTAANRENVAGSKLVTIRSENAAAVAAAVPVGSNSSGQSKADARSLKQYRQQLVKKLIADVEALPSNAHASDVEIDEAEEDVAADSSSDLESIESATAFSRRISVTSSTATSAEQRRRAMLYNRQKNGNDSAYRSLDTQSSVGGGSKLLYSTDELASSSRRQSNSSVGCFVDYQSTDRRFSAVEFRRPTMTEKARWMNGESWVTDWTRWRLGSQKESSNDGEVDTAIVGEDNMSTDLWNSRRRRQSSPAQHFRGLKVSEDAAAAETATWLQTFTNSVGRKMSDVETRLGHVLRHVTETASTTVHKTGHN